VSCEVSKPVGPVYKCMGLTLKVNNYNKVSNIEDMLVCT